MTQGPVLRQTLVAAVSSDKAFAEAVSANRVTLRTTGHCTPGVTFTWLAAARITSTEPKETRLASITACSFDVVFTAALPSDHTQRGVIMPITNATVQRTIWVTVAGHADSRVSDVSSWILIVKRFTGLTVATHGVVETVVTHTSTDVPRSHIHRHVKMTLVGVTVTVAFFAGISVTALSWSPGQVIIEVITLFTVQSVGVVFAHTPPVYHALNVIPDAVNRSTFGGVAIAEAVAPDNQLIYGIVVFLFDLGA